MNTLAVVLGKQGLTVGQEDLAITVGNCPPAALVELIGDLAAGPQPDPVAVAGTVRAKAHDKYDRYLSEDLLNLAYAHRALDVPGAWACLAELAARPGQFRLRITSSACRIIGGRRARPARNLLDRLTAVVSMHRSGRPPRRGRPTRLRKREQPCASQPEDDPCPQTPTIWTPS